MIGLDTNVLVRYFAQDDPVQSPTAARIVEQLSTGNPGFVSIVAMVETVWVLDRSYRLAAFEIAAVIELILKTEAFVVEHEKEVFGALTALREGADFADALLLALGREAGCAYTVTFDRKAARIPGFRLA